MSIVSSASGCANLLQGDFVYRTQQPLHITAARGMRLQTDDGRTLIDLHASSGASMLGYRADLIERACRRLQVLPAKPQFCESATRVSLASRLSELVLTATGRRGRIGFDIGGAQGIEQALKIVSASNPSADLVIALDGAYHGRSLGTATLSCSPRYRTGPGEGPFRTLRLPVPALVARRQGLSRAEATEWCIREVDALFTDERHGLVGGRERLHSFVFEPLLNVAGLIEIDPAYLARIAIYARQIGAAVIADEIFTGFFKTGQLLASAPVRPDIVVLSKVLTNGLCGLSAVWVSEDSQLVDGFRPGTHSSTFINGEIPLAIAHEVLDEFAGLRADELAAPGRGLQRLFDEVPLARLDACPEQFGNMARVEIPDPQLFARLQARLLAGPLGVMTATTGLAANTFIFHPAFILGDADVEAAAGVFRRAIDEALA